MAPINIILEASAGSEIAELLGQYITQELVGDLGAILLAVLMLVGAVLMLLASVGLIRLPDLPTRMHASTKAGSLGAALIMLAVAVAMPSAIVWAKVVAVIAFLLLTAPVAAHVIGRAGYFVGAGLWDGTIKDDLANQYDYETHTLHSGRFSEREIEGVDPGVKGVVDPEPETPKKPPEPAEREVAPKTLAQGTSDPVELDTELGLEAEGPGVDDSSEMDVPEDPDGFGPGDPVEKPEDKETVEEDSEEEDSEEENSEEENAKKKVGTEEEAPA